MQKKLPESVDFLKQVERNACFEGAWPLSGFTRLAEVLYNNEGEATARLKFGTRAGTNCLDGHVQAELVLRCERCLEPVKQHIESDFRFGLIARIVLEEMSGFGRVRPAGIAQIAVDCYGSGRTEDLE